MRGALRWPGIISLGWVAAACGGSTVADFASDASAGTAGSGGTGGTSTGGQGGTGGTSTGGQGGTGGTSTGGQGGTGGTSTGGQGGTGGVLLDGGPGDANPLDGSACAAESHTAQPVPRGLLVLLDRSVSMADEGKWDAVRDALIGFVGLPTVHGLNVGILPFPVPPSGPIPSACTTDADCGLYGPCIPQFSACAGTYAPNTSCDPLDYTAPAVPFTALPGGFATLESTLSNMAAEGEATPTTVVIEGGAEYAIAFNPAPDAIVDLVLLTDGDPTGCTVNDVDSVVTAVDDALTGTPSIRTFVIAVGAEPGMAQQIATAGGTSPAALVTPGAGAAQAVQSALEDAYRTPCAYRLPPLNDPSDVSKLNVSMKTAGQTETTVFLVASASDCDANGGWYFDDPASPSRIELCPSTCDMAREPSTETSMQVGCLTVQAP